METVKQQLRYPLIMAAAALLLGGAFNWLFYGHTLGISLLVFVALLVAVLTGLGVLEQKLPEPRNLWLLLPLLFFAAMVAVRANAFLTLLNVLAVLILLSYLAFFYARGRADSLGILGSILLPLRTWLHSGVLAVPLLAIGVSRMQISPRERRLLPVLRGGLLALPILVVFTLLLASADMVFARQVERLLALEYLPPFEELVGRGLLTGMAAWWLAGGLVYALAWRPGAQKTAVSDQSPLESWVQAWPRKYGLGFGEAATILAAVNVLFGAFVFVQFAYLFGGARHLSLEGITYAEYARRGFFELVTVAVMSLTLVLCLNWATRRGTKRQIRLFNLFSSGLAALVLVMLLSAWRRMSLYEAAFGFTELRLVVFVFMVWLAAILFWFLLTLWRSPHLFTIGLIMSAIGFLVSLNLLNPDAFIVRQNLARYAQTGDLDAAYLTTLSADAVPELLAALTTVQGDVQLVPTPACAGYWYRSAGTSSTDPCEATLAEVLQINLDGRFQAMQSNNSRQSWQSTHLAHLRAYHSLDQFNQ